jgi:hypothetical protein
VQGGRAAAIERATPQPRALPYFARQQIFCATSNNVRVAHENDLICSRAIQDEIVFSQHLLPSEGIYLAIAN